MKLITLILSSLFLVACSGGSSGGGTPAPAANNGLNNPPVFSGKIGGFAGEFINAETSWTRKNTVSQQSVVKKKALRLTIEQTAAKLEVTVWDGIGTTGQTIVSYYPHLNIDQNTGVLFNLDYGYKGIINENAFDITTQGYNGNVEVSIQTTFIRTSATTGLLRVHRKNVTANNVEDIYEGTFTLEP
jgi:hypothetical protein